MTASRRAPSRLVVLAAVLLAALLGCASLALAQEAPATTVPAAPATQAAPGRWNQRPPTRLPCPPAAA